MKMKYETPDFELTVFSFESILEEHLNVSDPENSGSGHKDDDNDDW